MAQKADPRTIFHLVPMNDVSHEALRHPDNKRFVSPSVDGDLALEIGFHVSSTPGRVMARLGRNTDLILQQRNVSTIHVSFELHPDTLVVLLSVRAKHASSVVVTPYGHSGEAEEEIEGDCVLGYGKMYDIQIAGYRFLLKWPETDPTPLRDRAIREYQRALTEQENARSRYLPTETDSEAHTWHNTRIHTARRILFREAEGNPRTRIGGGQFGMVYRAVDFESGNPFAVKVIQLNQYPDPEHARAVAHREIKALQRLKHKHIIEFLGHDKWETDKPEIFMPLRQGTLRSVIKARDRRLTDNELSTAVLEQMLSALDYLAWNDMCHRDVKPDNILYWTAPSGDYTFQLADFGLANYRAQALTMCGTGYYHAPELYPEYGTFAQSPKMDVWSLFATIADIHSQFSFPPLAAKTYADVLHAVRAAAQLEPSLAHMVRENPELRASAAQLLVVHFEGRGLSTPRSRVPPIVDVPTAPVTTVPARSAPPPYTPAKTPVPSPAAVPLVKYPREPRRPRQLDGAKAPTVFRPLGGNGITKPKSTGPPAWLSPRRSPGARTVAKGRAPAPAQLGQWITQAVAPDKATAEKGPEERKETQQPIAGPSRMPGSFPT